MTTDPEVTLHFCAALPPLHGGEPPTCCRLIEVLRRAALREDAQALAAACDEALRAMA